MASGRTRRRRLVITKGRCYRQVQGYPDFLMSGEEAFCTKRVMALGVGFQSKQLQVYYVYIYCCHKTLLL